MGLRSDELLSEGVAADGLGIECGGKRGLGTRNLSLLVEVQAKMLDEVIEAGARCLAVAEKGVTVLDLPPEWGLAEAFTPDPGQIGTLVELLNLNQMQAIVIIIILGTRNQLLQHLGPIGRQSVTLHKVDFAGS